MKRDYRLSRTAPLPFRATWIGSLAVVLLLIASLGAPAAATEPGAESPGGKDKTRDNGRIVVTYFHTSFRCPTCTRIETYSREAVEKSVSDEAGKEVVEFRILNVDEPENKHCIQDYKLYTKSLIIALERDWEVVRWKNLPDIWKLAGDRDRFHSYVQDEIREYRKDL